MSSFNFPAAPAPQAAAPIVSNPANVPVDASGVITNPTIEAPKLPTVEGMGVDRGDAAEFEILHHLVAEFRQGDRVTLADLGGDKVDTARLIKLGAVKSLKDAAPAAPAAPAPKAPAKK